MHRYVFTNQIVGVIFSRMLQIRRNSITFNEIFVICSRIRPILRRDNNAIISTSGGQLYNFLSDRSNIFELKGEQIITKYKNDKERNHLLSEMEDMFIAGTPSDILKTIRRVVASCL